MPVVSLAKIGDVLRPGLTPEALKKAKDTAPVFKRYLSSDLVPGEFSGFDPDSHRVDPDPKQGITMRDKLARLLSNAYSPQPGRLCMIKQDYRAADDVLEFMRREAGLKT